MNEIKAMETVYFNKDRYFSFELDKSTNQYYLCIPLTKGPVDYSEYYEISYELVKGYPDNSSEVEVFLRKCRDGEMFHLLLNGIKSEDIKKRGQPWYPV